MTVVEKIDFLIKSVNRNEASFSLKYRIRKHAISKWRNNTSEPKAFNVAFLCQKFGFDVDDFLDPTSSLDANNLRPNEHMIKSAKKNQDGRDEDYPPEDNARYEERD